MVDGRTPRDGLWLDGYTKSSQGKSSPCEPKGSGELKTYKTRLQMADQTLTLILIAHNPSFNHLVYYIDQSPGHRMQ